VTRAHAFLKSASLSRNFSTAYAHGLTIAMQKAKSNPVAAREILHRLSEAQPHRTVAQELLKRLPPE
jgi:hypothetical protein